MSIDETIEEFINLYKAVLGDPSVEQNTRSQKLDEFMKDLLRRKGFEEDMKFFKNVTASSECSA